MDHKARLWRKKSSEKTIVAKEKPDLSSKENETEVLWSEKEVESECLVKHLNEKLASAICECNAKDAIVANHKKMAQEAVAGREKAEAEAVFLKQELDETLLQKASANERLTQLNSTLKECMQQLSSIREDHEQRVHDAVTKTSREFEMALKKLEDKYAETSKRLGNLVVENSHLSNALLLKENLIEDLCRCKYQAEAEFNTLMARLDSTEKENAFLKYEYRMLEKDLEIRNEEMEYNRRAAYASQKKHLESVKRISKLEAECQRLRVLVQKRLPGPPALGKMSEVEIKGRNQTEMRRKNMKHMAGGIIARDSTIEDDFESRGKNISFLIERLSLMEEENKILKEVLAKRDDELRTSRATFAPTASKLSQAIAQLGELSKYPKLVELAEANHVFDELSLITSFGTGNNDEIIRSGSCTSPLISKYTSEGKMVAVSDMSLMDDFVEMEKLAIVSVDAPLGSSQTSSDGSYKLSGPPTKKSCDIDSTCKELVPVEPQLETISMSPRHSDWLQDVLKAILGESRVSNRSLDELLGDVKIALLDQTDSKHSVIPQLLPISGYISWKTPTTSPRVDFLKNNPEIGSLVEQHEGLIDEKDMKSPRKDLEVMQQLTNDKNTTLVDQLRESERRIEILQTELETLKESKRIIEEQVESLKVANEELDTQLTVSKVKLNGALQKLSSLEIELEDRSRCCEELEVTCLELGLQLQSVTSMELPKENADQEQKILPREWEITAASAKLAECQETILNLGKQLKSLACPKEAAEFDKVLSTANTTSRKKSNLRSSLRDQMLAEDSSAEYLKSPKTKEIMSAEEIKRSSVIHSQNHNVPVEPSNEYLDRNHLVVTPVVGSLAIVQSKKRAGGSSLLMKFFLRRKRGNRKKTSFSFGT